MKKKSYLKEKVDYTLVTIEILIIMFIAMTIESIGNKTYNIILVITIIVFVVIAEILAKYSRLVNED